MDRLINCHDLVVASGDDLITIRLHFGDLSLTTPGYAH